MSESLRWRVVLVSVTLVVVGLALLFGGRPESAASRETQEGFRLRALEERLKLGFDLRGGVELRYRVEGVLTPEQEKEMTPEQRAEARKTLGQRVQETLNVIRLRLDPEGTLQPDIRGEAGGVIVIRLQGFSPGEIARFKKLAEDMGVLELRMVVPDKEFANLSEEERGTVKRLKLIDRTEEGEIVREMYIQTRDDYNVTGKNIRSVHISTDRTGFPAVGFDLDTPGARQFARLTKRLALEGSAGEARLLAIMLNGKPMSAPRVTEEISGGRAIIEGRFSMEEVQELITILRAGSLPTRLLYESEVFIGPELGSDSLARGRTAVLISMAAVLVFMAGYYLLSGMIADFAVLLNVALILAVILLSDTFPGAAGVGGIVLTLPGIAGIVLTAGMSVDANVLIYERIREEREKGKVLRFAVKNGYERAFWTIFDSNLTTLITALVLWIFLKGPVKSFATTLAIGIVCSMFTALFCTRVIFDLLIGWNVIKDLRMMRLVSGTQVRFVKRAPLFITLSLLAIVVGMVAFTWRGRGNLGIEFTSGTAAQLVLTQETDIETVRRIVHDLGYLNAQVVTASKDATMVRQTTSREFVIRVPQQSVTETQQQREEVLERIETAFAGQVGTSPLVVKVDDVRPVTAQEDPYRGGSRVSISFFQEKEQPVEVPALSETSEITITDGTSVTNLGTESKPTAVTRKTEAALETASLEPKTIEAGLKAAGFTDTTLMLEENRKFYASVEFLTHEKDRQKIVDQLGRPGVFFLTEAYAYKQFVGPAQARELLWGAIIAIVISMGGIILYVWLRFGNVRYGLAAVAALAHDVLITLGAIAVGSYLAGTVVGRWLGLTNIEIDLNIIAALLTIVGYSINDTIVVFDRIRENLGRRTDVTGEIIDRSVNQTLSRTILTSFTTLLVCVILYLVGGRQLHGLAFCLTVGVVVGTYSSIFIASPLLVVTHAVAKDKRPGRS